MAPQRNEIVIGSETGSDING